MSELDPLQQEVQARKILLWLSFECSLGGNPHDCPLHTIRLKRHDERRRLIESMGGKECQQLCELHRLCLCRREQCLLVGKTLAVGSTDSDRKPIEVS